jgi:hypothetical protein
VALDLRLSLAIDLVRQGNSTRLYISEFLASILEARLVPLFWFPHSLAYSPGDFILSLTLTKVLSLVGVSIQTLTGKPTGKRPLRGQGVDVRTILEWTFKR